MKQTNKQTKNKNKNKKLRKIKHTIPKCEQYHKFQILLNLIKAPSYTKSIGRAQNKQINKQTNKQPNKQIKTRPWCAEGFKPTLFIFVPPFISKHPFNKNKHIPTLLPIKKKSMMQTS